MARWIGFALLAATVLAIGTWCALAVWFRYAGGDLVRGALAATIAVLAVATVTSLVTSRRRLAFTVYAVVIAVVFAWWSTIRPSNDRDWQPDVARNATATIDNDHLVVHNVRNFNWRSDTLAGLNKGEIAMPTVKEPLGEPPTRPDGTIVGNTAPIPVTPEMAAVLKRRQEQADAFSAADHRLPRTISPRDQARAAGAR
jgi:hypothetical protein